MSASLVGSEMCIRDRVGPRMGLCPVGAGPHLQEHIVDPARDRSKLGWHGLLHLEPAGEMGEDLSLIHISEPTRLALI
eukprot:9756721-Alexandrium_andersonii.AAC.1